jgi:hypothetical protein
LAVETMVSPPPNAWKRRAARLLAEPLVHFFVVGALLFVAHRLVVGDPRVIVVTLGVKAEVERHFRDGHGRAPSPSELGDALESWKRDEVLYREALHDGLDRNDATIRTVLADRERARAALEIPQRDPSAAELDGWLAAHRSLYEAPRRYDYGTIAFPKADRAASTEREKYERALEVGTDPRSLGRSIVGGDLTAEDLNGRVGPALAARIEALPIGQWQRLESDRDLLLVRVNAVEGGLPHADELHKRLLADWSYAAHKQAADRAVQAIVDRYQFEERP